MEMRESLSRGLHSLGGHDMGGVKGTTVLPGEAVNAEAMLNNCSDGLLRCHCAWAATSALGGGVSLGTTLFLGNALNRRGALGDSSKKGGGALFRTLRGRFRTAPIITLFIPGTPLKTTHLQKYA